MNSRVTVVRFTVICGNGDTTMSTDTTIALAQHHHRRYLEEAARERILTKTMSIQATRRRLSSTMMLVRTHLQGTRSPHRDSSPLATSPTTQDTVT